MTVCGSQNVFGVDHRTATQIVSLPIQYIAQQSHIGKFSQFSFVLKVVVWVNQTKSYFYIPLAESFLKGVHPIIFMLNIFPNSQLIQKCIHNQQLFQNTCWNCLHFWIKWELGKIFDTKMIGWTPFTCLRLSNGLSEYC